MTCVPHIIPTPAQGEGQTKPNQTWSKTNLSQTKLGLETRCPRGVQGTCHTPGGYGLTEESGWTWGNRRSMAAFGATIAIRRRGGPALQDRRAGQSKGCEVVGSITQDVGGHASAVSFSIICLWHAITMVFSRTIFQQML